MQWAIVITLSYHAKHVLHQLLKRYLELYKSLFVELVSLFLNRSYTSRNFEVLAVAKIRQDKLFQHKLVFFQNEETFVQLDELDELNRITQS